MEETIIEGCLKYDKKSQKMLYDKYKNMLYGICLRYSQNKEDAEDALLIGFTKIFKYLYKYKKDKPLECWLREIIINTTIDEYRKRERYNKGLCDDYTNHDIEKVAVDDIIEKLYIKDLLKMIQQLPEIYRVVFNLFAIDNYNHKEISKLLNINESASRCRYFRAKQILQNKIKTY